MGIRLFAFTAFVAAGLLFIVEPMAAKALLPLLGGSASVWSTCLAFFQAALLLGYAYAHALARLAPRSQVFAHLLVLTACVLIRASIVADPQTRPPSAAASLSAWLLWRLALDVGAPFVALAATSVLLQRWWTVAASAAPANPYPLYAASNLGSLAALLAYPLFIEPELALAAQAEWWRYGFAGFALLMAVCGVVTIVRARRDGPIESAAPTTTLHAGWRTVSSWIALAFVPSSLMQGVTTYLSTDLAPVPMLWVAPLGLYLLSFILTFAERPPISQTRAVRSLPIVALLLLPSLAAGLVQWWWLPVHLLFFFVAAVACHGELARRRPSAEGLTGFYLAMALGGVLGGAFNAFVAPVVFNRAAEYPIACVLACLAIAAASAQRPRGDRITRGATYAAVLFAIAAPTAADLGGISGTALGGLSVTAASGLFLYAVSTLRSRPIRFALALGAVIAAAGLSPGVDGRVLRRERNFYGVLRVTEVADRQVRRLFHGRTLHGEQSTDLQRLREPTTYYRAGSPAAQVFAMRNSRPDAARARISVVGLGIGSLACYATAGQAWTFYELDPAVEQIARDAALFTYLRDSDAARIDVVIGDARLQLASAPEHAADLILLDAFSSDAIPVHLLTREAMTLYAAKLAPRGVIAFHITNRYLDLEPVVDSLARERGWTSLIRRDVTVDADEKAHGKQRTIWVAVAEKAADLDALAADPRWTPTRGGRGVWTDDRSSLVDVFTLTPRASPPP